MSEKIEKPMSETTIQEHLEKEKRHREEDSTEHQEPEPSKRRELEKGGRPLSKSQSPGPPALLPVKSGFATAKGFGSIAPSQDIFAEAQTDTSTQTDANPTEAVSSTQEGSIDKDSYSAPVPKKSFASSKGFGSFSSGSAFTSSTSSGGFSSLLSSASQTSSGFSSLLDAAPQKSIFDTKPPSRKEAGDTADIDNVEEGDDDDSTQNENEEEDEQQYVAVKGLEKTAVPTGEEEETCVYSVKAKLFAIDPRNTVAGWKERGIGTLRILEDGIGRTRLVMRADAVLRVILNMPLHAKYKIEDGGESMGDKTIRVFGFEDGLGLWLAMRVGNPKVAQELRTAIEDAIKRLPSTQVTENVSGVVLDEVAALRKENEAPETTTTTQTIVEEQPPIVPADSVEEAELQNAKQIEEEKKGFEETTPITNGAADKEPDAVQQPTKQTV